MNSLLRKYKIAKIDWNYKDLAEATGASYGLLVQAYLGNRTFSKKLAKKLLKAGIITANKKELEWVNEPNS